MNLDIRWLIRRDFPEVLQIEKDGENLWNEEDFLKSLRQRNCIGMVCEVDEQIVGFMIYELHKNKLSIIKLGVDKNWRRKKIGQEMIVKLRSKLETSKRSSIDIAVNERNFEAQIFLKSCKFLAINVLREYYENKDDAYLFEYRIGPDIIEQEDEESEMETY